LYAGLESLRLGSDRQIAELLGLAPHTVAKRTTAVTGRGRGDGSGAGCRRRAQAGGKKLPR
jgi:hypothetical protein